MDCVRFSLRASEQPSKKRQLDSRGTSRRPYLFCIVCLLLERGSSSKDAIEAWHCRILLFKAFSSNTSIMKKRQYYPLALSLVLGGHWVTLSSVVAAATDAALSSSSSGEDDRQQQLSQLRRKRRTTSTGRTRPRRITRTSEVSIDDLAELFQLHNAFGDLRNSNNNYYGSSSNNHNNNHNEEDETDDASKVSRMAILRRKAPSDRDQENGSSNSNNEDYTEYGGYDYYDRSMPDKKTRTPTRKPSRAPDARPPTRRPTAPTARPSRRPTNRPTRQPTSEAPTRRPTAPAPRPTRRPTTEVPTRRPTTPAPRPTRPPVTTVPTSFPNCDGLNRGEAMTEILSEITSEDLLRDNATPQGLAYTWILLEDPLRVDPCTYPTVMQRYSLAVFYFSTTGTDWTTSTGWLSGESECSWFGVSCGSDGSDRVATISLRDNNLDGTLPSELEGIPSLEELSLRNNQLQGSFPQSIATLRSLTELDVEVNSMSGNPFETVLSLTSLRRLRLSFNSFTGSIPSSVAQLDRVREFWIAENQFDGPIPSAVGELLSLGTFARCNWYRGHTDSCSLFANCMLFLSLLCPQNPCSYTATTSAASFHRRWAI